MQPIAQAETEQAHHGLIRQSLPSHRRRMIRALIVDDEPDVCEQMRAVLPADDASST